MEDKELIERLAHGDETALQEIYERYGKSCLDAARRVLTDPGDADDVVQEVLVQLWDDPARYDPERGTLGGFLTTWVRNRALDSRRREGAYKRAAERASDRLASVIKPITRTDRTGLENALETLPNEQRELLEKMYYDGQTQADIADQTGVPLGTVKSRIRLGMSRLKDAFRNFGGGIMPRFRGQGEREPPS